MRAYSHIGATFVTPWNNFDFYRHDFINYAARTIRPDMVSLWPPTELAEGYYWEVVRENYTLEDQGRVMHMYYVNPLQHAEGMLTRICRRRRSSSKATSSTRTTRCRRCRRAT